MNREIRVVETRRLLCSEEQWIGETFQTSRKTHQAVQVVVGDRQLRVVSDVD